MRLEGNVRAAKLTAEEFEALAAQGVPYVGQLGCKVEHFERGLVDVRLPYQELFVRPGGTTCGPAMMALADITIYGVVLSLVGRVELAVTTDLNIHFLRKPKPGDLIARGRILKLGTRLAVGEALIVPAESEDAVAHATATYSIPGMTP
jgi:uncharacterized protein (TIGR00369 family)